jgi:hypothetical protein
MMKPERLVGLPQPQPRNGDRSTCIIVIGWFMGFYYGPSTPPGKGDKEDKEPGGCMEALILTRAAFGALALPLAILFGAVGGLIVMLYLFSIHPLFGLAGLIAVVIGVALFARWERGRFPSGPP